MKSTFMLAFGLMFALSPVVRCDEAKKDAELLEGVWIPASAELAGKQFPEATRKAMKLVMKGNTYKVSVGELLDVGTTKIDPSQKPKSIDVTGTEGPNRDKTYLAIYELDGDTLKICYDLSGKARPTEFKSKADSKLFLVVYKREKP